MTAQRYTNSAYASDQLLKRGWQHDRRRPTNPLMPGVMPQKEPAG
jgi:hypothetical protein